MNAEKEPFICPVSPQSHFPEDNSLGGRPAEHLSSSEDEIVGEEVVEHAEDAEDCAPKVVAIDPGLPTEKELEEHKADHANQLTWL